MELKNIHELSKHFNILWNKLADEYLKSDDQLQKKWGRHIKLNFNIGKEIDLSIVKTLRQYKTSKIENLLKDSIELRLKHTKELKSLISLEKLKESKE